MQHYKSCIDSKETVERIRRKTVSEEWNPFVARRQIYIFVLWERILLFSPNDLTTETYVLSYSCLYPILPDGAIPLDIELCFCQSIFNGNIKKGIRWGYLIGFFCTCGWWGEHEWSLMNGQDFFFTELLRWVLRWKNATKQVPLPSLEWFPTTWH